jgi:biofilm PGA synthesis N-glycosyltransferase PgaC
MTKKITVLIPAHNEEAAIKAAIASVREQADSVYVIADNCTDRTAAIASETGADVIETEGNLDKKAGAINQALGRLMPAMRDDDFVLVMDADGTLDAGFTDAARDRFSLDAGLAGVSGTFRGGPGGGFVGMLQRNEYARYARDVRRLKGRALVLTGTAAMFRVAALRDVLGARHDGRLPHGGGQVYDTHVLTEDNELTLALLHLGWRILAPRDCTLTTEVMLTWRDLAKQRLRWKRGAFENLHDYGFTRITLPYWGRQVLSLVSVIASFTYIVTAIIAAILGMFTLQPIWLAITGIFVVERAVTVRDRGWKQQLCALPLLIEMPFDLFLQGVQARAFVEVALGRKASW